MALLLLTFTVSTLALCLFAPAASAYADFNTWANRDTRLLEPVGYNIPGTSACRACQYTRTMDNFGNLGIGNGNRSLVKPEFINDAMKAFYNSLNASATSSNQTTGNATAGNVTSPGAAVENNTTVSRMNSTGDGGLLARDVNTGSCPTCQAAETQVPVEEGLTESLLPSNILAGGIIHEGVADTITFGHPFPHILNENPTENAVLYAKLFGLPMPDGSRMDFGVKSIGYEY